MNYAGPSGRHTPWKFTSKKKKQRSLPHKASHYWRGKIFRLEDNTKRQRHNLGIYWASIFISAYIHQQWECKEESLLAYFLFMRVPNMSRFTNSRAVFQR